MKRDQRQKEKENKPIQIEEQAIQNNQTQVSDDRQNKKRRKTFRSFLLSILFVLALVLALYVVKRERKEQFLSPSDLGFVVENYELGSQGLGNQVLGSQESGNQVLGSQESGSQVLGSQGLGSQAPGNQIPTQGFGGQTSIDQALENLEAWDKTQASVILNNNKPYFTAEEITTETYEAYSELDKYGRCGQAMACLSKELMPKGQREEIGMIKPTGWHTVKYPEQIPDRYLYNRCHLLAWCLTGENANERNLITGTRYMNVQGMLPYEELVAKYIERTGKHVMYRVTPIFDGKNMLAFGVQMEAYSVEDQGKDICFCVFCPNVQPGIEIDYRTGDSRAKQ